ncbi:MAG: hypothetical protein KY476_23240 [Planctomycetes bacterium]|nr:hypothetical protein [Planctomycetota bacterium]
MSSLLFGAVALATAIAAQSEPWPPRLNEAHDATIAIQSEVFLQVPETVTARRQQEGIAPFVVAATTPKVELAYHDDLGVAAVHRRLWSSWGDICVASDGRVYCGIGDHADDAGGNARCFLYRWDPKTSRLEQVVDMNQVVPRKPGQPAWSKIHAKIDEGADSRIYFSCTLNDGNRASQPQFAWNEQLPGGQLYCYDPATGATTVFANLPPRRVTATSLMDRRRNIWWCNLEAGEGNALWALDLKSKRVVFQSPDGTVAFNRSFALAADGTVYFNGENGIHRASPADGRIEPTKSAFRDSPGMRCATRESADGWIYGSTHKTSELFRYSPAKDQLELLGPNWLTGEYTTVMILSPDERFLYYLPGAHGKASTYGTPVIQYEIATGRRKVLAFLAEAVEQACGYVPGGTYGAKLSADGATLYVNFNGHAADAIRPEHMRPNGFGLCAFAAIHIPPSERAAPSASKD